MDDRTLTVTVHHGPEDETPRCLRVISGYELAEPVVLGRDPLLIGREEGSGLHLQAEGVSRRHARISFGNGGQYTIIDLGSKNGTFVNWSSIDVAPLRVGDRIDIGTVALRLERVDGTHESKDEPAMPPARMLLSARELEVAELVGKGLTNAEIGRTLGISRRTVATHLENAYQRLGIHSRAALVQRIATPES